MAEQTVHDVVNHSQSMDVVSSVDVSGTSQLVSATGEVEEIQASADQHYNPVDVTSQLQSHSEISYHGGPMEAVSGLDKVEISNVKFISKPNDTTSKTNVSQPFSASNHESLDPADVLVNGDAASFNGSEDYQHSVGTDTAPGSDNEQGKGSRGPTPHHDRSSSVAKRPASFKPVTVTKNYLAKTGVAPTAITKPVGDRASPTTQPASTAIQATRPRLVAKTGQNARSVNIGGTTATSGGPDASKVWNRNRPAPPPQPKQFTDEELKQQYGIHMATRLQADETGKESKWADIDDDEDDWAPETVEWMDGTKSTIVTAENQQSPPPDSRTGYVKGEIDESGRQSPSLAQRSMAVSSAGKTILRPGAARTPSQTKPGLVLKSVPESSAAPPKPTAGGLGGIGGVVVAGGAAAAAAAAAAAGGGGSKSPWAPLPPIDKASPITFNPPQVHHPQPQPPPPFSVRRDSQHQDPSVFLSQSPAKEIAADDFDRSWREGERRNRELFNSQSGRYEPVRNTRRASLRQDNGGFRAPAVLQRPSPGMSGPDSAFHPNRAIGQQEQRPLWARRDSSAIVDEPESQLERPGPGEFEIPPGYFNREIKVDSHVPPAIPVSDLTAAGAHRSPDQSMSPQDGSQTYSASGRVNPDGLNEEAWVVQQRKMRENIEFNRKRKQEEEAKEEAAKQERIRKKLESLGPPPPSNRDSRHSAESSLNEQTSNEMIATSPTASKSDLHSEATHDREDGTDHSWDPAKPYSPEMSTAKLHDALITKDAHLASDRSNPPFPQPLSKSFSDHAAPLSLSEETEHLPGLAQVPPHDRIPQPRSRVSPVINQASWNSSGMASNPSVRSNVWGPTSNDRTLGNGSFEPDFTRLPSIHLPSQPQGFSTAPPSGPIGPPSHSSPRLSSGASQSTPSPSPIYGHHLQGQGPHAMSPPGPATTDSQPNDVPPPVGSRGMTPSQLVAAKAAWANFPTQVQADESAARDRVRQEMAAKLANGQKSEWQPTYRETFRQTKAGDGLGQRQVVAVTKVTHEGSSIASDPKTTQATAPQPLTQPPPGYPAPGHSNLNNRPSRFFGPGGDLNQPTSGSRTPSQSIRPYDDPTPPPPDSDDHPAYGSGMKHPLVKMPNIAKVKLPPTSLPSLPTPGNVVMPPRFRTGPQPLVNQAAWQDRFNGLFNRRPQQTQLPQAPPPAVFQAPTTPAQAIASSTKTSLDVFLQPDAATVSLPQSAGRQAGVGWALSDSQIESRYAVEELMDEREFGSSPIVYLPKTEYTNAPILDIRPPPKYHSKAAQLELSSTFICSALALSFDYVEGHRITDAGTQAIIRVPGGSEKSVVIPKKTRQDSTSRNQSSRSQNVKKRFPSKGQKSLNPGAPLPPRTSPKSGEQRVSDGQPKPDGERRTSQGKPPRNSKKSLPNGSTAPSFVRSASNEQSSTQKAADSTASTTTQDKQSNRSRFPKPPSGKTSSGINPARI